MHRCPNAGSLGRYDCAITVAEDFAFVHLCVYEHVRVCVCVVHMVFYMLQLLY